MNCFKFQMTSKMSVFPKRLDYLFAEYFYYSNSGYAYDAAVVNLRSSRIFTVASLPTSLMIVRKISVNSSKTLSHVRFIDTTISRELSIAFERLRAIEKKFGYTVMWFSESPVPVPLF